MRSRPAVACPANYANRSEVKMLTVKKLDSNLIEDFLKLHSKEQGAEWCNCVAWWVPTWEGWDARTMEENRQLREALFQKSEFDGYLLFEDNVPIGWCQACIKNRLPKLSRQFPSSETTGTYAISCFFIAPEKRRTGMAAFLLQEILKDLKSNGVERVEAYPKAERDLPADEAWLGPIDLFIDAGFSPFITGTDSRVYLKVL